MQSIYSSVDEFWLTVILWPVRFSRVWLLFCVNSTVRRQSESCKIHLQKHIVLYSVSQVSYVVFQNIESKLKFLTKVVVIFLLFFCLQDCLSHQFNEVLSGWRIFCHCWTSKSLWLWQALHDITFVHNSLQTWSCCILYVDEENAPSSGLIHLVYRNRNI